MVKLLLIRDLQMFLPVHTMPMQLDGQQIKILQVVHQLQHLVLTSFVLVRRLSKCYGQQ